MRIDSHQHFWKFDPVRDSWITDDMAVIRTDFYPADLKPVLQENGFDGCVAVQASQSEQENELLLQFAEQNEFIKGIVGWVDLCSEKADQRLHYYRQCPKMKGFRHILQGEKDRAFMLRPEFLRGVKLLEKYGFAYDILIFPDQLPFAMEFAKQFPLLRCVIDHLAKPYIRSGKIDEWKQHIEAMANLPHVFCKLSGMVTEADLQHWKEDDFHPYLDVVVSAFGVERVMFGSDWPVCLVAASYKEVLRITENYFARFSSSDKELVFGKNAARFYRL